MYILKEKVPTLENNSLQLVLPYLGTIFYQTKTKLQRSIEGVLYKFQCGLYNESCYGENVRYFAVRSGRHIGMSPLTSERVKPRNIRSIIIC